MGGVGPAFPKWCKSITFETNAESNRIDIRAAGDHASCCGVNLAFVRLEMLNFLASGETVPPRSSLAFGKR